MSATTLKIEGELLNELNHLRPKDQSLSAFVRGILEQTIRKQQMIAAAEQYTDFLKSCSDEAMWLEEWEQTDLESPPQSKNRKPTS